MTTVGYGDTFPISPEGRAIGVLLMLLGIGLFGVVTANIAAFFVEEANIIEEDSSIPPADIETRLARIEVLLEQLANPEGHDWPAT
jgi:voltage-gated potassium channel